MGALYVTLFHGTTVTSARSIAQGGVGQRLHVTLDVQLAADYARFRAAAESADRAVVAFSVPVLMFQQWIADQSARTREGLHPFGCYVLYEPTWQYLWSRPASIWIFSQIGAMVAYVAA